MKTSVKLATIFTVVLGITPAISVAQIRGPVPVREETPGLLSLASTAPTLARLNAFGQFPGAQIVAAEILRRDNRIVYSFDLRLAEHEENERVLIDAMTGEVICVEYSVELDQGGHIVMTAPPTLVSMVRSSYTAANSAANEAAENGHVVRCKLRVENSRRLYVFDIEIGVEHEPTRILIDPYTGSVVSTQ